MTIAEALLPKLSDWEPANGGRHSWAQPVAETGWAVTLVADRTESLGCLLWEVTLVRSGDPVDNPELKRQALAVAKRVSGLMETLRLVEMDELRNEALLRSDSPTNRSGALTYYEVVMTGGQRIVLRRFQRSADKSHREQIAFALTHEVIAKLIEDLVQN